MTKFGLGAEQLRGVIKYHEGTRTVEFDLSKPLFLDQVDKNRCIVCLGCLYKVESRNAEGCLGLNP